MIEVSQTQGIYLKKMLANINKWHEDSTIEEAITILEEHSHLMTSYQSFSSESLSDSEINQVKSLVLSVKKLMLYLNEEKSELIDKIGQLNQSNKMATQYIKQFSESYFVDKDF